MKSASSKSSRFKIDLHMHSHLSHDGNATLEQYRRVIDTGKLDVLAITDHNEITFAQKLHQEFGDRVIIGEEVSTNEGDVIGLFLKELVRGYRPASDVMRAIKAQGGLVYVPHPFDLRRHGLGKEALLANLDQIDILETFNARNLTPGGNDLAQKFADEHQLLGAYGSDAHWVSELGTTYNLISEIPTRENFLDILRNAEHVGKKVSFRNFFSPAVNKVVNKFAKLFH